MAVFHDNSYMPNIKSSVKSLDKAWNNHHLNIYIARLWYFHTLNSDIKRC